MYENENEQISPIGEQDLADEPQIRFSLIEFFNIANNINEENYEQTMDKMKARRNVLLSMMRIYLAKFDNQLIMNEFDEQLNKAQKRGWLSPDVDYNEIPNKFTYTALASDLILKATSTDKNIVIIDEAGFNASAYKALGNPAVQMRYLGYNIRKIGSCLIIIAQAKRSVVPDLREELINYEIHLKRDKYDMRSMEILKRHEIYNPSKKEYDIHFLPYDDLDEIPMAHIPYDTKSTAGFIWDVNLHDIFFEIVENGYDAFEARENLPNIIKHLVADKKIEQHLKKKKFMSTGSVADLFKVSDRTIQLWADDGKLNCIKTDSGKRLFSRKEITDLAIKKGII